MTPEFSRPVRLDSLGGVPHRMAIEADAGERAALAERFGLRAISLLRAEAALTREGDVVTAAGRLEGAVVQACVASGADVTQRIDEPFTLRCVPETAAADEEIELGAGDLDTIAYAGGAVDMGEAAAQTLALALDPFPRAPDADAALRAAGVVTEEQRSPFAKLLDLKDRLAR